MAQNQYEQDIRLRILNTLLTCPHRDLTSLYRTHAEMADQDPRFYPRLAAWHAGNGSVRDHREVFAAVLSISEFPGHRDVGLALLRELPPYQVARVVDFIHGRVERRKVRVDAVKTNRRERVRAAVRGGANGKAEAPVAKAEVEAPKFEEKVERTGLFRNVPRSLRTEVERYLREREAKPEWFDECAISSRMALKRLYALLHIAPSDRAQAVLFDEAPAEGSRAAQVKALARAESPTEQARLIVEHRIPYRIAATAVKRMAPTVLVALVEVMTPQELINNLASLKRRGALDHPELKTLVEEKLERAKTDKRVSAYKAAEAKSAARAAGISEEIAAKLDAVTEAQVRSKARITRPTALLVDKSGSMQEAIAIAKQVGAMLAAVIDAPLYVYAFDTIALAIEPGGTDLASWEAAFAGIKANGGTSCGVAVARMMQKEQYVEQIVMVTDEGENAAPRLAEALVSYRERMKADPTICFLRTRGASQLLEQQLQRAGIPSDAYQFDGDYYALPNLLPVLSRPSKLELLMEIVEHPLPKRKAA